ncbi:unnamed protein product, partial [Amoebophrya sp. A25]
EGEGGGPYPGGPEDLQEVSATEDQVEQQNGLLHRPRDTTTSKATTASKNSKMSIPPGYRYASTNNKQDTTTTTTTTSNSVRSFDKYQQDGIILLTKGADNSMSEIASPEQPLEESRWLDEHILDFAHKGLIMKRRKK